MPDPRRFGPLTAIDSPEPALAVGDPAARHLRLTTTSVELWSATVKKDARAWHEVGMIDIDLPTTLWPDPRLADSIGPLLAGVFGGVYAADLQPVPVTVYSADVVDDWLIDGHHVNGYRRRDAKLATRLTRRLAEDPDSRTLLGLPDDLLARIHTMGGPPR